jgi:hypothetical protein
MAEFCKVCINYDDGTTVERYQVCYNSIGQVQSVKDLVTNLAVTDTGIISEIETHLVGGTPTATITERSNCDIDFAYPDFKACFGDGTDYIAELNFTERQDVENGVTVDVNKVSVDESKDAAIVVGETYTSFASEVVYVSGSADTKDLNITVNGVALQQMPCLECINC